MITSYLADAIILLIAAVLTVPFFQAIKLGAVPGFLIAGVAIGPYGLGLINNITEIGNLAEIGVVFLLFLVVIELKPSRLWQMRSMPEPSSAAHGCWRVLYGCCPKLWPYGSVVFLVRVRGGFSRAACSWGMKISNGHSVRSFHTSSEAVSCVP